MSSRLAKETKVSKKVSVALIPVQDKIEKAMTLLFGLSWVWRLKKQEEGLLALIEERVCLLSY